MNSLVSFYQVSFLSLYWSSLPFKPFYYSDNGTHIDELSFCTLPIDRLDGPPEFKCAISYMIQLLLGINRWWFHWIICYGNRCNFFFKISFFISSNDRGGKGKVLWGCWGVDTFKLHILEYVPISTNRALIRVQVDLFIYFMYVLNRAL